MITSGASKTVGFRYMGTSCSTISWYPQEIDFLHHLENNQSKSYFKCISMLFSSVDASVMIYHCIRNDLVLAKQNYKHPAPDEIMWNRSVNAEVNLGTSLLLHKYAIHMALQTGTVQRMFTCYAQIIRGIIDTVNSLI